jgi:hypothetical protein
MSKGWYPYSLHAVNVSQVDQLRHDLLTESNTELSAVSSVSILSFSSVSSARLLLFVPLTPLVPFVEGIEGLWISMVVVQDEKLLYDEELSPGGFQALQ